MEARRQQSPPGERSPSEPLSSFSPRGVRPQYTPRKSAGRSKLCLEGTNWERAQAEREHVQYRTMVIDVHVNRATRDAPRFVRHFVGINCSQHTPAGREALAARMACAPAGTTSTASVTLTEGATHGATFKVYDPRGYPYLAAVVTTFADYLGLSMMTPALPFYLNQIGLDASDQVALWNGAITTSQFIAVVIGNIVWGLLGDRLGPRRALQLTMLGDAVTFGLTAIVALPGLLLAVRFVAGLCTPLVPALLYVFERAPNPEGAIRGVGQYAMAILLGYCAGGAVISVGYEALGWQGVNLISTAVCALAFCHVTFLPAPSPNSGPRPRPSGVGRALRTAAFLNHATTAFVQGCAFSTLMVMTILILKDGFRMAAQQAGIIFISLPAVLLIVNVLVGCAAKRYGANALITTSAIAQTICVGVTAIPAAHQTLAPYLVLLTTQVVFITGQMVPNQSRAREIAAAYATNATGAVTGLGRVCYALGQGICPIVAAVLYTWHPSACYCLWAGLQIMQLLVLLASRQSPFRDAPLGEPASVPTRAEPQPAESEPRPRPLMVSRTHRTLTHLGESFHG